MAQALVGEGERRSQSISTRMRETAEGEHGRSELSAACTHEGRENGLVSAERQREGIFAPAHAQLTSLRAVRLGPATPPAPSSSYFLKKPAIAGTAAAALATRYARPSSLTPSATVSAPETEELGRSKASAADDSRGGSESDDNKEDIAGCAEEDCVAGLRLYF